MKINALHKKNKETKILIADRSPFSAVFYANHGHLLEPLIRAQLSEITEFTDIEMYTIHVSVHQDLLWHRILKRLEKEPERKGYKEDEYEWMIKTCDFYEKFKWDFKVENNEEGVEGCVEEIVTWISNQNLFFKEFLKLKILRKNSNPEKKLNIMRKNSESEESCIDTESSEEGDELIGCDLTFEDSFESFEDCETLLEDTI